MTSDGPKPGFGGVKSLTERVSDARTWFVLLLISIGTLSVWPESVPDTDEPSGLGERLVQIGEVAPKGGGHFKIGRPYEINGQRFVPHEDPSYDRRGVASWYGDLFHGRATANGEIFDMERLSAAHPTLPLPAYVEVTNLENGLKAVVRVNDRGPFHGGRLIDLSKRTAEVLGFKRAGTAEVRVRYLREAGLDGDDTFEREYLSTRGYSYYAGTSGPDGLPEVVIAVGPPEVRTPSAGPTATAALPPLPDRPERALVAASIAAPNPIVVRGGRAGGAGMQSAPGDVVTTGAIGPPLAPAQESMTQDFMPQGPMIQAGFFKNEAYAQRARSALARVGPVEIAPIIDQGETFYRVRVGPFADGISAAAALSDVADAGYRGAKIILNN